MNKKIKNEIKELVILVKLTERYESVVSNGVIPIDNQSFYFNAQRMNRIEELLRKYDVDLQISTI